MPLRYSLIIPKHYNAFESTFTLFTTSSVLDNNAQLAFQARKEICVAVCVSVFNDNIKWKSPDNFIG